MALGCCFGNLNGRLNQRRTGHPQVYTKSMIVLGLIHNTSRRFYVNVANTITRIRKYTSNKEEFLFSLQTMNCAQCWQLCWKTPNGSKAHFLGQIHCRIQLYQPIAPKVCGVTLISNAFPVGGCSLTHYESEFLHERSELQDRCTDTNKTMKYKYILQHDAFAEELKKNIFRDDLILNSSRPSKLNPTLDAGGVIRNGRAYL
ncbi:unnamed protein product [Menidia menidia]|uniref:(Atlantic silverside) hypothetical protein n=1 Tax=Menidia menidia TaxID=238744 RepID=A0A8S4B8V4_9TELE|nr:unnamed protein product [Menidia menidia]